jgi:hypothetical protein
MYPGVERCYVVVVGGKEIAETAPPEMTMVVVVSQSRFRSG